jgi:hypothetical protein
MPAITSALDAGRLAAGAVLDQLDVTWLEELDPDLFRSLNTPGDLERFYSAVASQR